MHNAVDARELVEALRSGRITPHVWVWRTGWTRWVRASQVTELVSAIPKGARLPPAAIEIDPEAVTPPPIPHYSFQDSKFVRHTSTPIPPATHQRHLARRPPTPTLVENHNVASQTLRPPGAVPPPPRTFSDNFALDVQRAIDLATFASDDPAALSAVIHQPSANSQHPSRPHLVPAPAPDFVIQSVLGAAEPTTRAHCSETSTLPKVGSTAPRPLRLQRKVLVAGISLVMVAAFVIVLLRAQVLKRERQQAAAQHAKQPPVHAFCRSAGSAERIAPNIVFNVPPFADTSADGRSLAVGFADNPSSAAGIIVDPASLSVKYAFRQATASKVANVVPRAAAGQLSFVVSLENEPLKEPRPIPGTTTMIIGHNVEGFVRQVPDAHPETIWQTDIDANVSGARLVSLGPLGYAMTYRQGGVNGSLWVGWLTPDGYSRAVPFSVPTSAKFIGQPSIAASGSRLLLSFAGRASEKDRWQVHLAAIDDTAREATERTFETPLGGAGGDSIAPSVVGLDDGHFLLQWSEGSVGHWQVRVQTLDEKLQPWGPAINTSPPDMNAGQGLLWVHDTHAVSLFIINVGKSAELWAAPLDCPR
jgi:hypothetical protein